MKLAELLKDSSYRLSQFKSAQIAALEAGITQKDTGKTLALYINCLVRNKPIKLTPEETVRQLYVMVLRDDLGYPVNRMELEYGVIFGREKKRADAYLATRFLCIFWHCPMPKWRLNAWRSVFARVGITFLKCSYVAVSRRVKSIWHAIARWWMTGMCMTTAASSLF